MFNKRFVIFSILAVAAFFAYRHFSRIEPVKSPTKKLTQQDSPTQSEKAKFELDEDFRQVIASNRVFERRVWVDTAGFSMIGGLVEPWKKTASLQEIAENFKDVAPRTRSKIDNILKDENLPAADRCERLVAKAAMYNMEGNPSEAYSTLTEARRVCMSSPDQGAKLLFTIIYLQGVAALRMGENENCIMCRGESSCILPIANSAIHKQEKGSRLAIKHFTEYLIKFPEDIEVRWLLNLAHMTLGEFPDKVDKRFVLSLDKFNDDKHSIGKFIDVGSRLGINRFNQAGGAILDDFDNDQLLDVVTTSFDPRAPMAVYKNLGTGKFENVTQTARVEDQLGGLNCVQTDYNNDGLLDIFVIRGAWYYDHMSVRPSLLKNVGHLQFEDVTKEAGLDYPVNSIAAQWADYDNDGWLDLLVACEAQRNRLYHNLRDGTFQEVAEAAGLVGEKDFQAKGIAWIDFDNDGFQDVFINNHSEVGGQFYQNNKDGTFTRISSQVGIDGPETGFACWTWDYNNDGYLDIFATSYKRTLAASVKGILGEPSEMRTNRLYRNDRGKGFTDVAEKDRLGYGLLLHGKQFWRLRQRRLSGYVSWHGRT